MYKKKKKTGDFFFAMGKKKILIFIKTRNLYKNKIYTFKNDFEK
jgi:hypothetical protein